MGTLINIDELLTVRSAAEELGFTTSWVNQLIQKGRIQTVLIDGVKFIARSEVERFKQKSQTLVAA